MERRRTRVSWLLYERTRAIARSLARRGLRQAPLCGNADLHRTRFGPYAGWAEYVDEGRGSRICWFQYLRCSIRPIWSKKLFNIKCLIFIKQEKQQIQREHEEAELRAQLHAMRNEHDSLLAASRQKDDRIQELSKEIRALEERCAEAEQSIKNNKISN